MNFDTLNNLYNNIPNNQDINKTLIDLKKTIDELEEQLRREEELFGENGILSETNADEHEGLDRNKILLRGWQPPAEGLFTEDNLGYGFDSDKPIPLSGFSRDLIQSLLQETRTRLFEARQRYFELSMQFSYTKKESLNKDIIKTQLSLLIIHKFQDEYKKDFKINKPDFSKPFLIGEFKNVPAPMKFIETGSGLAGPLFLSLKLPGALSFDDTNINIDSFNRMIDRLANEYDGSLEFKWPESSNHTYDEDRVPPDEC